MSTFLSLAAVVFLFVAVQIYRSSVNSVAKGVKPLPGPKGEPLPEETPDPLQSFVLTTYVKGGQLSVVPMI
jgi:hypothetical protein